MCAVRGDRYSTGMTNTADLARAARQLPFSLGNAETFPRNPTDEFTAAYQHAVREGVTLYWGQTRARGYVGFTTLAELVAVDSHIRAAVPPGQPAPAPVTCVPHRRITPDGEVVDVAADGTEKAPRARVMEGLAADLARLA